MTAAIATLKRKPGGQRRWSGRVVNLNAKIPAADLDEARAACKACGVTLSSLLRDGLALMVEKARRERNGGKPFLPIQPPQE